MKRRHRGGGILGSLVLAALVACGGGGGDGGPKQNVVALAAPDGAGGFLWKPVGDNSRLLVVLLPSEFNDRVTAVEIHRATPPDADTFVESGVFSAIANGNRTHWRFTQPGAAYGQNVYVMVYTNDVGEPGVQQIYSFPIANGAVRID